MAQFHVPSMSSGLCANRIGRMLCLTLEQAVTLRSPALTLLLASLVVTGCAVAHTPAAGDEHSAHHPPDSAPAAPAAVPTSTPASGAFEQQMKAMQAMHQRMQAAKTPAERAALMDEHMKLMQSGMAMMGQMRGAGAPGGGAQSSANTGMPGMMGMHQQMERRMAMMEQMMQMMVDREEAMLRK